MLNRRSYLRPGVTRKEVLFAYKIIQKHRNGSPKCILLEEALTMLNTGYMHENVTFNDVVYKQLNQ